MPAPENKKVEVKRLGIIAGSGDLPGRLANACDDPFIVAFEGHTDANTVQGYEHLWSRLGAMGAVIKALKARDIRDLVLIGAIRRPSVKELVPDLKAAEFYAKIGFQAMGDSDFLSALRKALEDEGFILHGVHEFAGDLLAPAGLLGGRKPKKADEADLKHGIKIAQEIGRLDIGQAVIVQGGIVLGVEAAEGTDALIARCKDLKRKGPGGVLVKLCKPQQDLALDLPTVGPQTIEYAAACGLAGIAVHAGKSLIVDRQAVVKSANAHKLFLMGVEIDE